MKRILMVCLGNICRSPMAEGILRHRLKQMGIESFVDSAGTSAWHEGERPDQRAIRECRKNGVDISAQRSRPLLHEDLDRFDLILAMDYENEHAIHKMATHEAQLAKVGMIMDYSHPGAGMVVPDQYYGGEDGFSNVYSLLDLAARKIIERHFPVKRSKDE